MRRLSLFIIFILCIFLSGCENQKTKQSPHNDFSQIIGSWKSEEPNKLTSKNDTLTITENSVRVDNIKTRQVTYFRQDNLIGVHPIDAPPGIAWISIVPQANGKILVKDKTFGDKVYIKTTPGDVETILNTQVEGPNSKPISLKR